MKVFWVFFYAFSLVPFHSQSWHGLFYKLGLRGSYPHHTYQSSEVVSPILNIEQLGSQCSNDYVLLSLHGWAMPAPGTLILDGSGNVVWMETRFGTVMDLKVQRFEGADYLTFWAGAKDEGYGQGVYYMVDSSYEVAYEIAAAGGLEGDLHEFKITDNNTALITIYEPTQSDLSSLGGPTEGWILDCLVQEIEITSGNLLWQWRSSDHFPVDESAVSLGKKGKTMEQAFDYFHINSIDKDADGNYYISARHLHIVASISPAGDVLWVLGGSRNQFDDHSEGAATNFSWQHHATWHANNTLSLFDNGATFDEVTASVSRGLVITLDLVNMTATLQASYVHPRGYLSPSQGSMQIVPGTNNVLLGYGHLPAYTEFSSDGEVLCHVEFGPEMYSLLGGVQSYRAVRSPWIGRPNRPPSIKLTRGFTDAIYVSWNGATEVTTWRLDDSPSGEDPGFQTFNEIAKDGFEARFSVDDNMSRYVRVAALDADGNVLGYSGTVDRISGHKVSATLQVPEDNEVSYISLNGLNVVPVVGLLIIAYMVRRYRRRITTTLSPRRFSKLWHYAR